MSRIVVGVPVVQEYLVPRAMAETIQHICPTNKVLAIKLLREHYDMQLHTSLGLKEAKDVVEEIYNKGVSYFTTTE